MPIGELVSAIGQIGLGIGNLAYTASANKQARADQLMMYYNTLPARQMALRRAAGLNPYGDISAVGANVPTPVNTASGVDSSFAQMAQGLDNATQYKFMRLANKVQMLQLENEATRLGIERDKLKQQEPLVEAQTSRENAVASYQQIVNEVANATKQNMIDKSDYELKSLIESYLSQLVNNTYLPDTLAATLANILQSTSESKSRVGVNTSQASLNKAQESFVGANELKALEEVNRLKFDNAGINYLNQFIDDLSKNSKIPKKYKDLIIATLRAGIIILQNKKN